MAPRLDELLWQLPPDRFVPHQPRAARGDRPSAATAALCLPINPARQTPLFAGHFAQVVDFVLY